MLASVFVIDGVETLRNPQPRVAAAAPLVDKAAPLVAKGEQAVNERVQTSVPPVPKDTETWVKVLAGVKVGAGVMYALGKAPRLSALALTASHVPTTVTRNAFWSESDPAAKSRKTTGLATDVALLGALLIATADTEGNPGLAWRARRVGNRVSAALPGAKSETAAIGATIAGAAGTAAEQAKHLAEQVQKQAPVVAEQVQKQAPVVAEQAREQAAHLADIVREKAPVVAEQAREQAAAAREQAAPLVSAASERAAEAREKAAPLAAAAAERVSDARENAAPKAAAAREKAAESRAVLRDRALVAREAAALKAAEKAASVDAATPSRAELRAGAGLGGRRAGAAVAETGAQARTALDQVRLDLSRSIRP